MIELSFYILIGILIIWYFTNSFLPAKGVNHIDATELKKVIKNKNFQLIDVRTTHEFNANHLKGFTNIPVSQVGQQRNMLDKEKEIVVLCQSGIRSNKVAKKLKKWGFKKVFNVKGGIITWKH